MPHRAGSSQTPLLVPARRQRPLQPLQHQGLVSHSPEDCLSDVRGKQRQPEDPAHVALSRCSQRRQSRLPRCGRLHRACAAIATPAPGPSEACCLPVASSLARFRCRRVRRCACGRLDAGSASGSARSACCHRAGLYAAHHAALLLSCCRSSATRLASPSALIRTSRACSCTSTRSTSSWAPARRETARSRPWRSRRA